MEGARTSALSLVSQQCGRAPGRRGEGRGGRERRRMRAAPAGPADRWYTGLAQWLKVPLVVGRRPLAPQLSSSRRRFATRQSVHAPVQSSKTARARQGRGVSD